MADFESHPPGTFCWPELAATDQKSAVVFYRALFGWEVREQPIGQNEVYSMFQMRGKDVAAACSMRPDQRQQGVPAHWGSYVSVASADETAGRTEQLGGKILAPAFDVFESGRMAVLQDPAGAVVSVWQPKKHIGVRILNEPGALCWTELATSDLDRAEKFYTQLFGWSAKTSNMGGMTYTEFSNKGTTLAGMMKLRPEWGSIPPHWLPYFQVLNCDAIAARAKELGGSIHVPAGDIPDVGRFAMLADPQRGMFAIFTPSRA